MKQKLLRLAALSGGLALAGASHAAAVDVADLVTDIGAQVAPIALVGGAVLLVVVAVKAFRWVRSAMS